MHSNVGERLEAAWKRSDRFFALLAQPALQARPIALRQPFIFYLGHLPAFAWNQAGRLLSGGSSRNPRFDVLFERGIDPTDTDDTAPADDLWPRLEEVLSYRDRVREAVRPAFGDPRFREALSMVLEHEAMHHETLLYMMLRLPHELKLRPADLSPPIFGPAAPSRRVRVPGGVVRLGAERGTLPFGWDNEFPSHDAEVPPFVIDATPVRNAEFLEFVRAGGYRERRLWTDEAWVWRGRRGLTHPSFWQETAGGWTHRTLFEDVPLEAAADWPVFVTWSEAHAYARFLGGRLPTEAEYHRAAFGSPDGDRRSYPWGDEPPRAGHGNFGFRRWTPTPVGFHAEGASAWGVLDLAGNGWDWTETSFAPFPGFDPLPTYPTYSAGFFDGRHRVLLGGSWATDDGLMRRSFRNWFQPHYPHVFAQFRCVSGDGSSSRGAVRPATP